MFATLSEEYGNVTRESLSLKDGEATLKIRTSSLAGRQIPLDIKILGASKVFHKNIEILPGDAMYIDLSVSTDKFEADDSASSIVQATLKDRFGNDVYTDSSSELTLEISESTSHLGRVDQSPLKLESGTARFRVYGSDLPGTIHYKVTSLTDLAQNSFTAFSPVPFTLSEMKIPALKSGGSLSERGEAFFTRYDDQQYITIYSSLESLEESLSYSELPASLQEQLSEFWLAQNQYEIHGISENAGSLETYYFWDGEEITGNSYNSLYSVLIGAPYGDITQEAYLAGELLFDGENRALTVTSILNDPYAFSDVFRISNSGDVASLSSADITQDMQLSLSVIDGRLVYDIYNSSFGQYVARIYQDSTKLSDLEVDVLDDSIVIDKSGKQFALKDSSGKKLLSFSPQTAWYQSDSTQLLPVE